MLFTEEDIDNAIDRARDCVRNETGGWKHAFTKEQIIKSLKQTVAHRNMMEYQALCESVEGGYVVSPGVNKMAQELLDFSYPRPASEYFKQEQIVDMKHSIPPATKEYMEEMEMKLTDFINSHSAADIIDLVLEPDHKKRQMSLIDNRIKHHNDFITSQMKLKKAERNQRDINQSYDTLKRLKEWKQQIQK